MNGLISDLAAWRQRFAGATRQHAQLYYRRVMESYDIATRQWKNFERIQYEYENLIRAADYFRSTQNSQAAQEISFVSLALLEQGLQKRLKGSQDLVEQAKATAENIVSLANEYNTLADDLMSRINQGLARARSIAAGISQSNEGEYGATELSDEEEKE